MSAQAAHWGNTEGANRPPVHPLAIKALADLDEFLTPAGKELFLQEVSEALTPSAGKDNFKELQRVLHSWYRTFVVRQNADYFLGAEWAQTEESSKGKRLEEIREELGL